MWWSKSKLLWEIDLKIFSFTKVTVVLHYLVYNLFMIDIIKILVYEIKLKFLSQWKNILCLTSKNIGFQLNEIKLLKVL